MNEQLNTGKTAGERLACIEEHVRCRFLGRMRNFQLVYREDGLVLRGRVRTYYTKQLAQHAVLSATDLPIRANEIEVF